ncbi:DNA (cytosine-5-)-methyltransferase, partial [Companilactobacillus sp.]|uniref:DNA (cytosine-5-)-methyltransferase n=1 Tax=Companilactobacillus sp. TaxID=2767905 RepID=UPI002619EC00
EDKPSYLFIENVKNLLSINKGWDFAKLLIEMDEIGYDVEWDVLDSADVAPQHRERIFIVGHLRGRRTRKVFPIVRKSGETNKPDKEVNQIGNISNSKSFGGNPQVGRVYGTNGIAPTLSTMQGGGQEPKIAIREATKIGYDIAGIGDSINFSQPNSKTRRGRVGHGVANTLTTSIEQATLTDDLKIRKLTPLECWRLQGFPDYAFNIAREAGLSDSQLYKQAGNSVTVPVIKSIAENMEVFN